MEGLWYCKATRSNTLEKIPCTAYDAHMNKKRVAVLIPCYNEEKTIGKVVDDFKKALPEAQIFVYDNNSTDNSEKIAVECGATVRNELRQGKGYVVQRMFMDIDADIYIMVDGDDTYPAEEIRALIKPIESGIADMVVGDRLKDLQDGEMKSLNLFGNKLIRSFLNTLFRVELRDILSGYRVFNREFVRNVPIRSEGFEIETEITLKALERDMRIVEVPISFQDRPDGSFSKINHFGDGIRIFRTMLRILRDYRPFVFFTAVATALFVPAGVFGYIVIDQYLKTGLVDRIPLWITAIFLTLISLLFFVTGFILRSINQRIDDVEDLLKKR